MEFLREDDDFSEGEDFLIEASQLTLDIIRQQVERPVLTRRARINRDRLGAHARLVEDYFSKDPKYPEHLFRRPFRMSRNLFSRVRNDLAQNYDFFQQRCDGRGNIGFFGLQKCTSAIQQLAYGTSTWRGQFQRGDHPRPTFMLEAVASQDLWIWHAFFGASGSNNDINVLDQSPIYNDLIEGKAPDNGRAICEVYEEDDPNLLEHVEINDEEKQENRRMLRNEDTHVNLKADLIEHLWKNRFY
ncbi:hypothetical protein E3N88_43895 [Mikania micrantha]|uniref:Uncharacterized protein n=1 Tax=Mikania micrantha TaxID=192012 RepID=A0A5N6LDM7_9ASTR|nr:hypothetical protein E3N88_43895 [Mikania micrantha]